MRQPTPQAEAFAWYDAALAGKSPPITSEPEPGFYRMRKFKGAPFVPAAVWLHAETDPDTGELISDERLVAVVNGESRDPDAIWLSCCNNPIPEHDYRYRVDYGRWAEVHAPDDPAANPLKSSSLSEQPSLF